MGRSTSLRRRGPASRPCNRGLWAIRSTEDLRPMDAVAGSDAAAARLGHLPCGGGMALPEEEAGAVAVPHSPCL